MFRRGALALSPVLRNTATRGAFSASPVVYNKPATRHEPTKSAISKAVGPQISNFFAASTSGPPSSPAEYIVAGVDKLINWARKGSLW